MPHYADGTLAKPGDWVKGPTYNQPDVREGIIARITSEGDACNCVVQFLPVTEEEVAQYPDGSAGKDWDYTAVKDLTPIRRTLAR